MSEVRNLVSKLNDRNIQKSRETGITLYVVCGVLVVITQRLIVNFEGMYNFELMFSLLQAMIVVWVVLDGMNLIFASFIIKVGFFKETRVVSQSIKKYTILGGAIQLIQFIVPITIAVSLLVQECQWYFIIVFLTYILVLFLHTSNIVMKWMRKSHSSTKIMDDSGFSLSKIKRYENIWFAVGVLFIGVSIMYALITERTIPTNDLTKITVFTVFSFGLLYVGNIALELYKSSVVDNMLKDLEVQIYLKNIKDEDIIEVLQSQFIGIELSEWIVKKREQVQWHYIQDMQLVEVIINEWLPQKINEKLWDKAMLARTKFVTEIKIIQDDVVNIAYKEKHAYTDLDDSIVQEFIEYLHSKITEFDIHLETRFASLTS